MVVEPAETWPDAGLIHKDSTSCFMHNASLQENETVGKTMFAGAGEMLGMISWETEHSSLWFRITKLSITVVLCNYPQLLYKYYQILQKSRAMAWQVPLSLTIVCHEGKLKTSATLSNTANLKSIEIIWNLIFKKWGFSSIGSPRTDTFSQEGHFNFGPKDPKVCWPGPRWFPCDALANHLGADVPLVWTSLDTFFSVARDININY